jgi:hypothetical protein
MIRPEVRTLAEFGPLGDEESCPQGELEAIEDSYSRIERRLTLDEARILLPLLDRPSEDSLFGLAWSVLHLLETAPGWPPEELNSPRMDPRPWIERLRCRLCGE